MKFLWIKVDGTLYETPEGHVVWAKEKVLKFTGKENQAEATQVWQELTGEVRVSLGLDEAIFYICRGVTKNQVSTIKSLAEDVSRISWQISISGVKDSNQHSGTMPEELQKLLAALNTDNLLRESRNDMIRAANKFHLRYEGSTAYRDKELFFFTDPITKSTFSVKQYSDIPRALANIRQQFRVPVHEHTIGGHKKSFYTIDEKVSVEGLRKLLRVYQYYEEGKEPNRLDVISSLEMLKSYYEEFVPWFKKIESRDEKEKLLFSHYEDRLNEIISALESGDKKEQIIALDNAINQWHIDYPVIAHLGMEAEDTEGAILSDDIASILSRLGRLPEHSPYIEESIIDFPLDGLSPEIWIEHNGKYSLLPNVKKKILLTLQKYPKFSLLAIPGAAYHITGSIGTNQYQEDSDIDVHIIPIIGSNYDDEGVQKDVFIWFNEFREEIEGYVGRHPIEVYIQLNPNQEYLSEAVYDLVSDTWLKGPTITPIEFDPYEEFSDILDDIQEETGKADVLLGELRRDVIDYTVIREYVKKNLPIPVKQNLLVRLQSRLEEIEQDVKDLFTLRGEWVRDRNLSSQPTTVEQALSDIEMAKTWRDKNALFKFLNRYNYLKLIGDLETMIADEEISDRDVNIIRRMIGV
jgi:ACT domain-containing protein